MAGPLTRKPAHHREPASRTGPWVWNNSTACSAPEQAWHFTSCPACQCNGHSVCDKPGQCSQPCQHNTQGEHCQRCTEGYFGHPVNGGECGKCECNGQGSLCDHRSGNCFCTTKGETSVKLNRLGSDKLQFDSPL